MQKPLPAPCSPRLSWASPRPPPSPALSRTFTSADGSKSFQAELLDYTKGKDSETALVRQKSGKTVRFKLDLLSQEDQDYIRAEAPALKAAKAVQISVSMNQDKTSDKVANNWQNTQYTHSYDIRLQNTRSDYLENITLDYTISSSAPSAMDPPPSSGSPAPTTSPPSCPRRPRKSPPPKPSSTAGNSPRPPKAAAADDAPPTLPAVRWEPAKSPPPPPPRHLAPRKTRRHPRRRREKTRYRDNLLGIIVRVSVEDKVIKTYSSSPKLLEMEAAEDESKEES